MQLPRWYHGLTETLRTDKVSLSQHYTRIDPVMTQTCHLVSGILVMWELIEANPEFEWKLMWELMHIKDYIRNDVCFRLNAWQNTVANFYFTLNEEFFDLKKQQQKQWIEILLIDKRILMGVMQLADDFCWQNYPLRKNQIIKELPFLKRIYDENVGRTESIVIKSSVETPLEHS